MGHESRIRRTTVHVKANWGSWVGQTLAGMTMLGLLLLSAAIVLAGAASVIVAWRWLRTMFLLLILAR